MALVKKNRREIQKRMAAWKDNNQSGQKNSARYFFQWAEADSFF
jgi:hypothetical protein